MSTTTKPRLIVVAGPDGSGKTSFTEAALRHGWMRGCEYINPDNIAQEHFGDWNSPEDIAQAAQWAARQRDACINGRGDFAFETALSAPDKVDFVLRALQAGYFVRLFFIATQSPSINAARIAERVMEGGHEVPINKIVSRYPKSIANCSLLASVVDRLYVYDNSVENAAPTLCFRAISGQITTHISTPPTWSNAIHNALKSHLRLRF
jgi:predicted ABC-type ATPase